MPDPAPKEKKPKVKRKIIQVIPDNNGILGVLYDDGRVFLWNWAKRPGEFVKAPQGEGFWGELTYPEL